MVIEVRFTTLMRTAVHTEKVNGGNQNRKKSPTDRRGKKLNFLYVCLYCYVQAQQYNLREATGTQFFGQTQGGDRLQGGAHRRNKGKLLPQSLNQNKVSPAHAQHCCK